MGRDGDTKKLMQRESDMSGESQTISEYIVHHLTNLTYGKLPEGTVRYDGSVVGEGGQWAMAHGGEEIAAMGFNAIHVDSLAWSVGNSEYSTISYFPFLLPITPTFSEAFLFGTALHEHNKSSLALNPT